MNHNPRTLIAEERIGGELAYRFGEGEWNLIRGTRGGILAALHLVETDPSLGRLRRYLDRIAERRRGALRDPGGGGTM